MLAIGRAKGSFCITWFRVNVLVYELMCVHSFDECGVDSFDLCGELCAMDLTYKILDSGNKYREISREYKQRCTFRGH
jgi:hypothetical protein